MGNFDTTESFIEKAKKIHGDKYNYSKLVYINSREGVEIICPIHGSFWQRAGDHLCRKGCKKCANKYKLTTEEFIKKAKEVHGNYYDYSLVDYKSNKGKIIIICPKHGEFEQIARNHLNGAGCHICNNEKCSKRLTLTTEEFIKKAKEVHDNYYDYSLVDYKDSNTPVKIICPIHGVFEQKPIYHTHNYAGCQKCKESKGERKIRKYLQNKNVIFEGQKKFKECKDVLPLPFDFYIPSKEILIEYQGEQHYRDTFHMGYKKWLKQRHHDWLKRKYAKDNGYKLLTIPYWDYNIIENILEENLK